MVIFLSIDLGTTGLKTGLVDLSGRVVASTSSEYAIQTPQAGFAEQDPEAWWQALIACCSDLKKTHGDQFDRIEGVGICGQMHTQVYLDEQNRILRPAITWMDQRSESIVAEINQNPETKKLVFEQTQNLASTTYTAPQAKWVRDHQPDIWAKVRHILLAKDFLKFRLTGNMAIDYADATGTLLFNTAEEKWSPAMFDLFGLSKDMLPEVGSGHDIIGRVSAEAARITGIREGAPVANGSADCSAAALGAGMTESGQVTMIIGTAGVVAVCSDHPLPDSEDRTLCWHYCLDRKWISVAITQTAGESLQWFKNAFDRNSDQGLPSGDIFQQYNNTIRDVPDGSGGLIFLPYLNGERTPYWDSAARGVFFGINLATGKGHFIKAIMEGVSFALRHCVETVESLGLKIDRVMAVGGGLKSEVWLNTLGKITRKPIQTVENPDTGLVANMLLCAKGLGLIDSIPETAARVVKSQSLIHYPEESPVYEKQYHQYLNLYGDLKDRFRIAARE